MNWERRASRRKGSAKNLGSLSVNGAALPGAGHAGQQRGSIHHQEEPALSFGQNPERGEWIGVKGKGERWAGGQTEASSVSTRGRN
jgi:hypothetical protein